ncbi:MAG TPA: protein AcsF, partial [Armatimonadetes bacterium]|nr:protein AcsF [Armatimonadota bacterium]
MGYSIGVAGKGGTGKTTIAALVIKWLKERGKVPILAVDADPNANLPESLGFKDDTSIGTVLEDFLRKRESLPPGMPKEAFLEVKLNEV